MQIAQSESTKAKVAKVEAMKVLKSAYSRAKKEGRVKTYRISPV